MSSFTIHEKLLDFKTFFVCVDIFLAAAIRLARTAPFCAGRRGIRKKRLAGRNPEVFSRGSGAAHLKIRPKRTVSDKVCPILSNFVHKKWQKQFEKT